VAGCDAIEASLLDESLKKAAARFASRLLQVLRGGSYILGVEMKRETGHTGELCDELCIAERLFATKLMVQVKHFKADAQFRGQFPKDREKADRICAAGDCHSDALARTGHLVTSDNSADAFNRR
jgi:hypothetical protein